MLLGELVDLLKYQYNRIDFIDAPVDVGFDCPLDLHCTYTRDQLLVALDFLKPATVREGVKWLPDQKLERLFDQRVAVPLAEPEHHGGAFLYRPAVYPP